MSYCIVVVGYNRPFALKRLLNSLSKAVYEQPCDLIISLDYWEDQNQLIRISEEYIWENGKKQIRAFQESQGLKKHILQCGDLTDRYDAIIVLEDDLVVSEGFFQYVCEAVEFYYNDENIAGISLYTHRTNPGNGRPFEAQFNGKDVFFMQYAMSWGQCWTRKMWKKFRNWYEQNPIMVKDGIVPDYVMEWNQQSWLKYYIRYTVENNLFYVYPYFSLTTNSSEVGEHNLQNSSAYQVPMEYGNIKGYRFADVNNAVKYDAYFERILDKRDNKIKSKKILLDLYGMRKVFFDADILVSTQILNYRIIDSLELKYRPQEVNWFISEKGNGIYVYDLANKEKNRGKNTIFSIIFYDMKAESSKLTLIHGLYGILRKILLKVRR